jgi:glycosyltransferase involved in cell wall biosynthesis
MIQKGLDSRRAGYARGAFGGSRVKVAVDARPASDPHGLGRYTRCLLRALNETAAPGDELVRTRRPQAFARTPTADVFHSPWLAGAMLHSACPTVVSARCLSSLKRRSQQLGPGLRQRLRHLAVQRAAAMIVPTRAVGEDAVAHLGVDEARIAVVPQAADPSMRPRSAEEVDAVRARLGLPQDYLLWVGGLEHPDPKLHVGDLVAAKRDLPLVLVGATRPWAHELPGVILTGRLADDDLAAVYSGAHALVLPSELDSFDLQGVEALACGTPVVAFEAPGRREALGSSAELVQGGDIRELVDRAQASTRPAPAPPPWSWEDAARETWRVYARAAAAAGRERPPARVRRRAPTAAARIDGLEPR